MKDYLIKSIINDGMFRAYVINGTNLVQEAQKRHDTWSCCHRCARSLTSGYDHVSWIVTKGRR